VLTVCACAGDDGGGGGGTHGTCELPSAELPQVPPDDVDERAFERYRCAFEKGDKVDTTLGPNATTVISSELKHVIVLMRENRSYDHMMGAYRQEESPQSPPLYPDELVTNPDASAHNAPVQRFHEQHYCTGNPAHEWSDVHLQFNNGGLDGFVAASNRSARNSGGCVSMGYYNGDDIPFYYWLADHFAISQNYHSSMLGPTMPNLMFYFFATSCGQTDNSEATIVSCPDDTPSIFSLMQGKASFAVYSDSTPKSFGAAVRLTDTLATSVKSIGDFENDLRNDTLPEVVFVEPNYWHSHIGTENDEHPPSNIQDGQAFVYRITSALMASPAWSSSIMFITWDEHGGFYDHVVPPVACAPDKAVPTDFDFKHLGFRTPFFAISPFAKAGYVSHYTADHTSILRFIEAWKGLGALTKRDANAWPLFDMFDFSSSRVTEMPDAALAAKSTSPLHVAMCADDAPVSSSCAQ
jgi:phospholipase C